MSDEAAPELKKRRGRPPGKKAKRHGPEDAPIDGNPGCDVILNRDPAFDYMLASDEDIPTMLYRGAVVCQRDNEQARPFFDMRQNAGEADIKVKNLTVMKIEKAKNAKFQGQGLSIAKQRLASLKRNAVGSVGGGLSSINTNFEDGGYRRQEI